MVTVLDLFSGTGSVPKACRYLKYKCISLDIDNKYHEPTIRVDILKWDYKSAFKPGEIDVIFAGVPCTEYSAMNYLNSKLYGKVPNIYLANKIVKRTLKIIKYLKPSVFFIENPENGTLKNQSFMKLLKFYVVSYCKYGFDYQKNTRIWTNLINFEAKRCNMDCKKIVNGTHIKNIGHRTTDTSNKVSNLGTKYSYPPKLIRCLLRAAEEQIKM